MDPEAVCAHPRAQLQVACTLLGVRCQARLRRMGVSIGLELQ